MGRPKLENSIKKLRTKLKDGDFVGIENTAATNIIKYRTVLEASWKLTGKPQKESMIKNILNVFAKHIDDSVSAKVKATDFFLAEVAACESGKYDGQKENWETDGRRSNCGCGARFSMGSRHHCRGCGLLFCGGCCPRGISVGWFCNEPRMCIPNKTRRMGCKGMGVLHRQATDAELENAGLKILEDRFDTVQGPQQDDLEARLKALRD